MSSETDGNNAALIAAVQAQDIEAINRALDSGADINALDVGGLAALHYAVFADNAEIASLLIEHGANVELPSAEKGDDGVTPRISPLCHCAIENSLAVAEVLLQKGAIANGCDPEDFSALGWAAQESHEDLVRLLVRFGADINGDSGQEYILPTNLVKLLLAHGARADVADKDAMTALDYVRKFRNAEIQARVEGALTAA